MTSSLQVSWTLLSIPANLSNAVVGMVLACVMISKSFSPFINPLGSIPSAPVKIGITVSRSHSCPIAFLVLWQGLNTCPSFRFL